MAPRLLRTAALALLLALVPAAAPASRAGHGPHHDEGGNGKGHRDAPPQFVATQWLVRIPAGALAGFVAHAVDPDGGPVTITWAFDDGTTAAGERVAKAWATPGPRTSTVTATDTSGRSTTRTFRVEVIADAAGAPQPGVVHLRRPGPSAAAIARVALAAGTLRLGADGSVSLVLSCASADCAGRVSLAHAGRRLAAARYAIAAGHRAAVRLRVPAGAAARLRRREERPVVVTLAPDGQAPARVARALRTG
jgi:PKD domain-containing protein